MTEKMKNPLKFVLRLKKTPGFYEKVIYPNTLKWQTLIEFELLDLAAESWNLLFQDLYGRGINYITVCF
jgi:hypothetical protein